MSHPLIPLGEVAELIRGITYKPSDVCSATDPTAVACMRTKNVQEALDESDIYWIPASLIRSSSKYLKAGDILVSSANSWNLVGKGCWVPELNYPASAGGFISILRGSPAAVDLRYLYHWFISPQTQAKMRSYSNKTTNISNLDHSRTLATEIPLPPLEEQRRIAAILDKAQDIKVKAAHRSDQLSTFCRSLFVRRFGLPSENPYELPRHRLVDICNPKQWPTISSKQLQDCGYPVFGANGLIGYFDTFNHPDPTVLVTCRGATCGTINVSPPNCYVTGNSMAMDNPDPALLTTEYLEWVLRLRGMHDVISGSAQPQITRQGLEAVSIPVPSIEAQNVFANELKAVTRVVASSRLSENSISEVADSFAAQFFEGGRA